MFGFGHWWIKKEREPMIEGEFVWRVQQDMVDSNSNEQKYIIGTVEQTKSNRLAVKVVSYLLVLPVQ